MIRTVLTISKRNVYYIVDSMVPHNYMHRITVYSQVVFWCEEFSFRIVPLRARYGTLLVYWLQLFYYLRFWFHCGLVHPFSIYTTTPQRLSAHNDCPAISFTGHDRVIMCQTVLLRYHTYHISLSRFYREVYLHNYFSRNHMSPTI